MTGNGPLLRQLRYCLGENFPAPLTAAMLTLAENPTLEHLREAFTVWSCPDANTCENHAWHDHRDGYDFIVAVEEITDTSCAFCDDCNKVVWEVNSTLEVCDDCLTNYSQCSSCDEYAQDVTCVGYDSMYCESCLNSYFTYCDQCDEYISDDDDEHSHTCGCSAPHRRFEFPNDGHGTVSQNECVTVELPKGTIDEEGISLITNLVQEAIDGTRMWGVAGSNHFYVYGDMDEVGNLWQTKQGNFTRRLSSMLYKKHAFKLPAGLISEVGNIARAHSSDDALWIIDFTRDLNGSAEEFYHEDSCWFTGGSYGQSRCALKQWGGMGLRTYDSENAHGWHQPTGRAWVQPLDKDLKPTHDTMNAHAYIVYNGYGALEGYTAARIVAHLTSRTYRKVEFYAHPQFINSENGYLVADEDTCLNTNRVSYEHDEHYTFDADTYTQMKVCAA